MTSVRLMNRVNPLTERESEEVETPYSRDHWRIVECPTDGMIYLKNPPENMVQKDQTARVDSGIEPKSQRHVDEPFRTAISSLLKLLRTKIRKRASVEIESERLLIRLRGESDQPTVVDIGCGTGQNLLRITSYMLDEYGMNIEPVGIEGSHEQAHQADNQLKAVGGYCVHNSAIDGLAAIAENSIDLIILCSFLQHEIKPMELLRQCHAKLSEHGRLLIKVPNYDCKNRKYRQEKWCGFRYPDHVNYFVPKTLHNMIEKAGLSCRNLRAQPFNDNMWAIAGK